MKKSIKGLAPDLLGRWAVITGGSSGIGFAHASILAEHGFDLLLAARDPEKLDSAARELSALYPIQVETLSADLAAESGQMQLVDRINQLDVGVLIGNAGVPSPGWFTEIELEQYMQGIGLKIQGNIAISHAVARQMKQKGAGAILLVSSTGGLQGIPYLSNNAAAEAYVLSLGEALHHELKPIGVKASVLMPGPTQTPALDAMAGGKKLPMKPMSAHATALEGLSALMRGEPSWVAGRANRIMAKLLPRRLASKMMGAMMGKILGAQPLKVSVEIKP
ncbi:SDR family NAD(P)-dependent oxidoreductase [Maritalea porphyrae]|uniref:Short-chain dehydrogenase n=1 Tax=Maritalea porphyrae TaxID=880732 RepID=A0ABQ5UXF3_9HYPH|nr:SDR family NAD(P)-dependent oxidoreductase [Maritalea porphyrae]GLQ19041.1 short-chain dehydrogenase [Maritalea porphyrae]